MEILQTIWNALTTENEMLTLIICSPLTFLEVYISTLLFTRILRLETDKMKNLLYILLFSIIALISIFIVPTPYNTFINVLSCPLLVYFIYKTNILKSILAEIIPYVIFIITGSFLINIYLSILNISSDTALLVPIYKFSYSLLLYFVVYLIYLVIKHFNFNINIINSLKKNISAILLINLMVGIIAIAIQSYLSTIYADTLSFGISISSIIVLLVYFIISMYSLFRTNKLEITTQDLEQEKLYNKTITILYDNIRDFRHNFNNIIQAFGGFISNNNMEGLKTYYNEVLNASQISNNLAVLNPELINNPAVYSILSSKYYTAEEFGIKMNLEILLDLKNLNIKTYDLTLILGILLDNAIDAAKESDEKQIDVIIRKDNKASRDLFIIENSYANKDIDMDRIFEKGYTSKEDEDNQSHGLGLWNVRKILKKNNNLNLFTSKDNKLFKQQLEIYS